MDTQNAMTGVTLNRLPSPRVVTSVHGPLRRFAASQHDGRSGVQSVRAAKGPQPSRTRWNAIAGPYGASFSALPRAVFVIVAGTAQVLASKTVTVSPCLSYRVHPVPGRSFHSVQFVLPLISHVPCQIAPPGVL